MVKVVSFDCETHLIQPGLLAPPLVCASMATEDGACLLSAAEARDVFRGILESSATWANANNSFDAGVMLADAERQSRAAYESLVELVFRKYERAEVHDVLLAQALDAVAGGHLYRLPNGQDMRHPVTGEVKGRYSLDIVSWLVLGRSDAKARDFWRLRYAILEHVPPADWPPDAREYPVDDARNARDTTLVQLGLEGCKRREHEWVLPQGLTCEMCLHCGVKLGFGETSACVERALPAKPFRNLDGMPRAARLDLALHLGSTHGLRTDRAWIEALAAKTSARAAKYRSDHTEFFHAGHELGCLKRMEAAGVTPEQAAALGPRLDEDGKVKAPTVHCVTSCKDGKEKGPLIARMVAEAYGATGLCPACQGRGRRPGAKGNDVGCKAQYFKHEPGAITCGGTGLDLRTARQMPRSDGGDVKCDRDAKTESGDERLMSFADDEHEKIATTYLPFLRRGVDAPLTLSANAILETLRVSYNGPIQQMPREGEARTAFRARPGYVFFSDDYSGIELCTLAQVCLWTVGFSQMAKIINETGDPGGLHAAFGAQMLGVDAVAFKAKVKAGDAEAKKFRQAAKAANFGFPGGMGAAKLVAAKRKKNEGETVAPDGKVYSGIRFCLLLGGAERCGARKVTTWRDRDTPPVCEACCVQAEILRERWLSFFPEIPRYFSYVKGKTERDGSIQLAGLPYQRREHWLPGTVRGGVGFTDGSNGHFQTLAAYLGTTAHWRASVECYVDRTSVLYGTTRLPFFVHDELFGETKTDIAHLTAPRVASIMEATGAEVVPNVVTKVEPALSRAWLKAMEPAYAADGRLIPWEDSEAGAKYLKKKGWLLNV